MAGAHKRRKLEHVSDEEDKSASSASFDGLDDVSINGDKSLFNKSDDDLVDSQEPDFSEITDRPRDHENGIEIEDEDEDEDEDADLEENEDEGEDGFEDEVVVNKKAPGERTNEQNNDLAEHNGRLLNAKPTDGQRALQKRSTGIHEPGASKSTSFRLQMDDLLQQIRPKHTRREAQAEDALHALKSTIEAIPPRGPFTVIEAQDKLIREKIAIPFPEPKPPKDTQLKFEYVKPASINVVGSHPLKTANRSRQNLFVDMVVELPSAIFQNKDYLNYRYFYKRAFYLACIASGIRAAHSKIFEIKFQNHHDDPLRPVIVIRRRQTSQSSAEDATPKWQINILPAISENIFPVKKLSLGEKCVRNASLVAGTRPVGTDGPTPFYNSSLRSDMLVISYLKLLHQSSTKCEGFRDACVLGSTWLRQRGFRATCKKGGFGSFEWSALLAVLLIGGGPGKRPLLSERYNSYQIMKATLQLLAMKDLSTNSLNVGSGDMTSISVNDGSPVIWDAERAHNILYKMTPWSYKLLQAEAKATLDMLGEQRFDSFEATFVWKKDYELMCNDFVLEINNAQLSKQTPHYDHQAFSSQQKLYTVLRKGLGDRINMISMNADRSEPWDIGSARPRYTTKATVRVGFVVNPDTVLRSVDHGPSAEDKEEAADFRQFWGEKAELRRFKDGSIREALVWNQSLDGISVFEQVVRYILLRHVGPTVAQDAILNDDSSTRVLGRHNYLAGFSALREAYKKLESDVRALEGLPLPIRQMAPSDAQMRNASLILPTPGNAGSYRPISVVLQFESSGRWPDDMMAIQRTKLAFLLKMSAILRDATDDVTTNVGLENEEQDFLNQGYLDVLYSTGLFRIRIYHDREQTLLERHLKDNTLDPKRRELSALALNRYKRDYVRGPAHTQAIAQLCSRNPALSGTILMLKKWFAAHLLSSHVPEEVIELFAAHTFVQPWPWQTPSSAQTGFLRTIAWLARWDWRFEPLILDLSGNRELKDAEVTTIQTRFEAWRKLDTALNRVVMFVASNVDPDGTTYTDGQPSKVAAGRMTALARAAFAEIETQGLRLDLLSLFASPLGDFDFVIHLAPEFAEGPRKKKSKNGTVFKNLELDAAVDFTAVAYDPAADLLSELEATFGSAILFFSGLPERPVIGGLWSPLTAERPWKVNLAYSTKPHNSNTSDDVHAEANKSAMLSEMANLGGDLIKRIKVRQS